MPKQDHEQPPKPADQPKRTQAWRANARGLGKGDDAPGVSNYTLCQAFEWHTEGGGKHWNWLKEKAPEFAEMGITAVWIPPPYKCDTKDSTGYSPYDLWDLGEFDQKGSVATKYGTKQELLDAIKALKENGILVYIDAVLNHKAGADRAETFKVVKVDEEDRTKVISEPFDIEGWTAFDFEGRGDKYSPMKWTFEHFNGVDYDNKTQESAIYKILGDNKGWNKNVDGSEKGVFDYLMSANIDVSHPIVREELINWGKWIIRETGADGFRFDAVRHIDEKFLAEFVRAVREDQDNPDLFCVGEFWMQDLDVINGYLDKFPEQFSCFDAPLHDNFYQAGMQNEEYDLTKIFDGTLVQTRPTDAVTIVANHDTQPGQTCEAPVGAWFAPLAYSLIMLRGDGYPSVFLGDLVGCKSDPPVEPINQLADFIRARKWFAYGPTRDYWDHRNCIGWVREGDENHDGCAVVMCNGTEDGTKRMQIQGNDEHKGEEWIDVLGWSADKTITIGDDGWADFTCPSKSVSIWVKKGARGLEHFKNAPKQE